MTPTDLIKAARDRKSIIRFGPVPGRLPAAFVISMPFAYVMQRLKPARVYKPKTKKLK